ncbi:glycoside hydrolase domain-containing protein [Mucilaginibacter sp. AW1-3]
MAHQEEMPRMENERRTILMNHLQRLFFLGSLLACANVQAQQAHYNDKVNVFLGTAGDHGQLSPGACAPFGLLDVSPETYPATHTGYDHRAKSFLGFSHNRLEGVGCKGSGGNLLIKPLLKNTTLIKQSEQARPGYYAVGFQNGIGVSISVKGNIATEHYTGQQQLFLDLSHALANGFVAEQHSWNSGILSGWIESGTTCRFGTYKTYYTVRFSSPVKISDSTAHMLTLDCAKSITLTVHFSAKSEDNFENEAKWEQELSRIKVSGDPEEEKLFYSLLYRTLQAPYQIADHAYSGWSIWDNYRNELPLLSIIEPERYQDMINSIVKLYQTGKKDWATQREPSNTVRTEHAIVVLLDAYRKGYPVDFSHIKDSLIAENKRLDDKTPDKALESSYDSWAMSQVLAILKEDSLSRVYLNKAANWKSSWNKDFKNLSKPDVDHLEARGMYQGTIWQYRWFVPFDVEGLIAACGGESAYLKQLDTFFAQDYYCASNEPDLQAPYMYQFTSRPWQSQQMIRHYAKDTVIQYYQDNNYRGIGAQIGRVYNNRPDGLLQTMDEDMGEMSAWYVMAAIGLSPACVGWPVYNLHVPLFRTVSFGKFQVIVKGKGRYIRSVSFDRRPFKRNWLSHQEIMRGGTLVITASTVPNKNFGIQNQWMTSLNPSKNH